MGNIIPEGQDAMDFVGSILETANEVSLTPQPGGARMIYLVETRTPEGPQEIMQIFEDISSQAFVRQLCEGRLMAFAVQVEPEKSELLIEIEELLREKYSLVVTQDFFDELIFRIMGELCAECGGEVLFVPKCDICGKHNPFPNMYVTFANDYCELVAQRNYCTVCCAIAARSTSKEFLLALLQADRLDFSAIRNIELDKRPKKNNRMRFKLVPGPDPCLGCESACEHKAAHEQRCPVAH